MEREETTETNGREISSTVRALEGIDTGAETGIIGGHAYTTDSR